MKLFLSKKERQDIEQMARGLSLPATIACSLVVLIFTTAIFFLVHTIIAKTWVCDCELTSFNSNSVVPSFIATMLVIILFRHYINKVALIVTGQYNATTLARGGMKPAFTFMGRVKQFIPTIFSWKWLLFLWVVANALDCVSTALALHYGATEANPTARSAENMYISKWFGVAFLTFGVVFFQMKGFLKFVTMLIFLVALHNFAIMGMVMIQPSLASCQPVVSMPAFAIELGETSLVAVILLWHHEILQWVKRIKFLRRP